MPKVLILGGRGFIGEKVTSVFKANNFNVVQLGSKEVQGSETKYHRVSLFDNLNLIRVLKLEKPDLVISTAWDTEPGKFWTSDLNLKYKNATLNFAELSFQANVSAFIGLGTVSEYGLSPGACDAAETPLKKINVYSKSKIETGLLLKLLGEKYGSKTHWARIFQAFGPNEKAERYIPSLISSLRSGNKFLVKTPDYVLDWIHTEDIADAIYFGYSRKMNHFLDIGTGIGTSVSDLSLDICSILNYDPELLDFSQANPEDKRVAFVSANSQLLANGWAPNLPISHRFLSLD